MPLVRVHVVLVHQRFKVHVISACWSCERTEKLNEGIEIGFYHMTSEGERSNLVADLFLLLAFSACILF